MGYDPQKALVRRSITELGALVVPDYSRRLWWYQRALAEALEGLLRYTRFRGEKGGYARVVVSMPPRHGKSLHAELLAALAHGIDPDLKIMAATNGATLSKQGVANTRQWMSTPGYQATFGTRIGAVESYDEKTGERLGVVTGVDAALKYETLKPRAPGSTEYVKASGYYLSQGISGSLTGQGFELGIMDDLVKNAEEAMSTAHHAKLWAFYTSTFDTRENHEFAGQLYIGTRWTDPDFADELVEYWQSQSNADRPLPIKLLRFPAIAEEPLEEGDPREVGEGLDNPEIHSRGYYEGKKAALMTQQPWVWYGLFQQRPKALGARFFQPDEWGYFNESFDLSRLDYIAFSIDCAAMESGASWSVITVAGVLVAGSDSGKNVGEHFFLLDEARGHWDFDDLSDELVRVWNKWSTALPDQARAGKILIENKAMGPNLVSRHGDEMPIEPVPKAKAKIFCYRVASQVTSQLRVWLPSGTWGEDPTSPSEPLITNEWVGDKHTKGSWVHEQMSYPSDPNDRRDTLAQLIIICTSWIDSELLGRQ